MNSVASTADAATDEFDRQRTRSGTDLKPVSVGMKWNVSGDSRDIT